MTKRDREHKMKRQHMKLATKVFTETTKVFLFCTLYIATFFAIITASLRIAQHFDLSQNWGLAGATLVIALLFSFWVAYLKVTLTSETEVTV